MALPELDDRHDLDRAEGCLGNRLAKGGKNAYRDAMIILVVGTAVGAVHYFASMALRGKAAPANMELYINILTLLLFLILKIPGVRERVHFGHPADDGVGQAAAGLAAITVGLVVITTNLWVGGSHLYEGANWTYVLREFLVGSGLASIGMGSLILTVPAFKVARLKRTAPAG